MGIQNQKKVVLVIGGHDPSGGAGIQADIESITYAGCMAVTIISSLTTQNTNTVLKVIPQSSGNFREQFKAVMQDIKIDACKIGMLGSSKLTQIVYEELSDKNIPIVLDPVMYSGTGIPFINDSIYEKIINLLIPLATVVTPNSIEAKILSKKETIDAAAKNLIGYGCCALLITGTHDKTKNEVINRLYLENGNHHEYSWQRLAFNYHGSGCTLASSIAAQLAMGNDIESSVVKAQNYTWNTLKYGLLIGNGQHHPNRFFDK